MVVVGILVALWCTRFAAIDVWFEPSDYSGAGQYADDATAAAGFGTLAISYARRAGLGRRVVLIGIRGGPVVLGSVLVVLPAILGAVGLLSGS